MDGELADGDLQRLAFLLCSSRLQISRQQGGLTDIVPRYDLGRRRWITADWGRGARDQKNQARCRDVRFWDANCVSFSASLFCLDFAGQSAVMTLPGQAPCIRTCNLLPGGVFAALRRPWFSTPSLQGSGAAPACIARPSWALGLFIVFAELRPVSRRPGGHTLSSVEPVRACVSRGASTRLGAGPAFLCRRVPCIFITIRAYWRGPSSRPKYLLAAPTVPRMPAPMPGAEYGVRVHMYVCTYVHAGTVSSHVVGPGPRLPRWVNPPLAGCSCFPEAVMRASPGAVTGQVAAARRAWCLQSLSHH